jgi:hypothetical protein
MPYLGKAELKASKIKRWTGVPGAIVSIPYSTIGFIPWNEVSTFVTINGIKQHDSAYLLNTTNARMEFSSTLNVADEVEIVCIFDVGVPTYLDVIENTVDVTALKTSDGTAGQVLTTDGAGNLSFSSAGLGDLDGGNSTTVYSVADIIIDSGGAT